MWVDYLICGVRRMLTASDSKRLRLGNFCQQRQQYSLEEIEGVLFCG